MKDKTARVLAIVALVFMGLFVAALVATLVDSTLFNGSVGYVALTTGVFALMIFIALKADGRGYSVTQMNNEIEMEKLREAAEKEAAEKEAAENAEKDDGANAETKGGAEGEPDGAQAEQTENSVGENDVAENAETDNGEA
ncbi:MAG: hypothetical protein NC184_06705 [Roseburia sp.]|nr:hypothetical protein [Roseburia sp.]